MKLLIILDATKYNDNWDKYDFILCEKKYPHISADKQFTFDAFKPHRDEVLKIFNKQFDFFLKLIPSSLLMKKEFVRPFSGVAL